MVTLLKKTNMSKDAAFPVSFQDNTTFANEGLSKREYFAGLALQGLLCNPGYTCNNNDALLAELGKEKQ